MKKDINSILIINKYLVYSRNDKDKLSYTRLYLNEKLNRALKNKNRTFSLKIFNLPLDIFSF